VDNLADKDAFVEALLQERDELYQELSKLRQIDGGALAQAEKKIAQFQKGSGVSSGKHPVKNTYLQIRPSGRLTLTGLKYFPKKRKQSRLQPVK